MKYSLKLFAIIMFVVITKLSCNNKNQEKMKTDTNELTEIGTEPVQM